MSTFTSMSIKNVKLYIFTYLSCYLRQYFAYLSLKRFIKNKNLQMQILAVADWPKYENY
jgi:hypothetical protein